ncbi:hypothetical protein GCM10022289_10000 [Pedobacter jeongneungensis]|uniref:Uncharacterized protein n=1 Tax=Pedobacter jeongneungensis TaxID=947309 RepID=A0ABP8B789_9SPHI
MKTNVLKFIILCGILGILALSSFKSSNSVRMASMNIEVESYLKYKNKGNIAERALSMMPAPQTIRIVNSEDDSRSMAMDQESLSNVLYKY